jgi:uncharacterized protein (TIGR03545 family)
MFKVFRWQGLVAFAAILGCAAVFWMVLVDGLVKSAVEKVGTRVVGAKVELGGADVSFFPLGLELKGLQVTDPDSPMTNAIEAKRIAFNLDPGQLVFSRVIVNEMSLEGMRLGSKRKTSGAIAPKAKTEPDSGKKEDTSSGEKKEGGMFGSVETPDAKDILEKEKENLRTVTLSKEIQAQIQKEEDSWKERIAKLPDRKKLDEYRKRAKEIEKLAKAGGLPGTIEAAKKSDELSKDIKADEKRIKKAQKKLKNTILSLENQLNELKRTPAADTARLMNKYGLTGTGAVNISQVLAGPVVSHRIDQVLSLWAKYGPFIKRVRAAQEKEKTEKPKRGKGINVSFPERRPMPKVLVHKTMVTTEIKGSSLSGEILNITSDQEMLGKPMTFALSGKELKWAEVAVFTGKMDRTRPEKPQDTFNARITGYGTGDMELSGGGTLPVTFKSGNANLTMNASLEDWRFTAKADAVLSGLSLELDRERAKLGSLGDPIAKALASIDSANVNALAQGNRQAYDLKVSSDIDDRLSSAVQDVFREQAREFERQLNDELQSMAGQRIEGLRKDISDFGLEGKKLDAAKDTLNDLLSGL